MAFMAQRKEVAVETSEAMELRFRPIAPKPMSPPPPSNMLWQAHKRGRQDYPVPSSVPKRERDAMSYPPPVWCPTGTGEVPMVTRGWCMPESFLPSCEEHLRRLSLEGSSAAVWVPPPEVRPSFPVERDFISKLQVPKVIRPRAARPLRTSISIDCSNIIDGTTSEVGVVKSKKTVMEVVAEMELPHALPTIVSGYHNNRVHITNDAYKAMVGQLICPWLDFVPGVGASRRINGDVVLSVRSFNTGPRLANPRSAFPCTARISWEREDATASLTVPCAVEHLAENALDYRFIWKFDRSRASVMYCIA
ncbi:hypothetical protein HU200_035151 [Digitaria exilis]|uniref:Uncharacterized protein n=1 Tax=Digitaria exilis TaxID=1010633 RepID=A0A835BFH0_9POAL|nr:hypothetical protein HU200_035151 [Digitaria exilis]